MLVRRSGRAHALVSGIDVAGSAGAFRRNATHKPVVRSPDTPGRAAITLMAESARALAVDGAQVGVVGAMDAGRVALVRCLGRPTHCGTEALVVAAPARAFRRDGARCALIRASDARLAAETGCGAVAVWSLRGRPGRGRIEEDVDGPDYGASRWTIHARRPEQLTGTAEWEVRTAFLAIIGIAAADILQHAGHAHWAVRIAAADYLRAAAGY